CEAALFEFIEHHVGYVVGGVKSNKIQKRERPHGITATKLHGIVDIRNRANTLFVSADRVQQVGDEEPVHDEPGFVTRPDGNLAQFPAKFGSRLVNVGSCRNSFYYFDKLHQRDGIEEVHPDHSLRTLHRRKQFRNGDGGGIRREYRFFLNDRIDGCEHFLFFGNILDDGFDHNVAVGKIFFFRRAFQACSYRIRVFDRSFLSELGQGFLDSGKSLVEKSLFHLEDGHVESRSRTHLRNSGTHKSTPKNTNFSDFHTSSCPKVSGFVLLLPGASKDNR